MSPLSKRATCSDSLSARDILANAEGKDKNINSRRRQLDAARLLLRESEGKGKIPARVLLFALDYVRPVLGPVLRQLENSSSLHRVEEALGHDSTLWSFVKLMLIDDEESSEE